MKGLAAALAALFILGGGGAAADEPVSCGKPVRLDRDGGPLQGFPIDNQFQNGSCFAHVAAIVLYAYEKSHGVSKPPIISPASLSLSYAQSMHASDVDEQVEKSVNINSGGDVCNTINGYLEYGGCYSSELTETIGKRKPLRELTDDLLVRYQSFRTYLSMADEQAENRRKLDLAIGRAIYMLTGDATALQPTPVAIPAADFDLEASFLAAYKGHTVEYWKALRKAPEAANGVAQCLSDSGLDAARIPSVTSITPVLSQDDSIRFLRTVLEGTCRKDPDTVFANVRCREVREHTHGVTSPYDLSELDKLLDRDEPAALAISGDFLQTGKPDLQHNHAVAVIGRRTAAGGQCEYLIRNSWGKSCKHYAPRFREACGLGQLWLKRSEIRGAYVMGELGLPR